jgi:hypothetical protein
LPLKVGDNLAPSGAGLFEFLLRKVGSLVAILKIDAIPSDLFGFVGHVASGADRAAIRP